MFKKTKSPESTLFESPSNLLRGRALKKYDDPKAWHNQFYELVTPNIDEDKFKPLFKSGNMGRCNASISQLVAINERWATAGATIRCLKRWTSTFLYARLSGL